MEGERERDDGEREGESEGGREGGKAGEVIALLVN